MEVWFFRSLKRTMPGSLRAAVLISGAACAGAALISTLRASGRPLRFISSLASRGATERLGDDLTFGTWLVGASQVVLSSPRRHAVAVELNPIVDGHLVVTSRRAVTRAHELNEEEWLELWRTAHDAQSLAERRRGAPASNLLLKEATSASAADGHVHVHAVPRVSGDFARNDAVFDAMDLWGPTAEASRARQGAPRLDVPADEDRRDRTAAQMADEASAYRGGPSAAAAPHTFGRFSIDAAHVFFESDLSVGFVNLRPLVQGHVLVTPKRVAPRLQDLSCDERDDLWRSVRLVQQAVEARVGADWSELGVQDGKEAGQSVPHVHVHVLPRKAGD